MRVGVISDTHGLLRPEAVEALRGSDLILHAGDIGSPAVLEALAAVAPVQAVRGNNDVEPWALAVPETLTLELAGHRIHLLHDAKQLALDPLREGIAVLIAGHSHKPLCERREGVLHLNPGSAGPRRFSLPVSVAMLELHADGIECELVTLG